MSGTENKATFIAREDLKIWIDEDGSQAQIIVPEWSWIASACRRSLNEATVVLLSFSNFSWEGVARAVHQHDGDRLLIELSKDPIAIE